MNRKTSWRAAAATLVWVALAAATARADVIMDWNAQADAIAASQKLSSPVHSRAATLMHVAMFEAVNAIERRYQPYRLSLVALALRMRPRTLMEGDGWDSWMNGMHLGADG